MNIDDVRAQVGAEMSVSCRCCPNQELRHVCVREKSIQVKRIMDKESWKIFDVLRIMKDLCPLKNVISKEWENWGKQVSLDNQAKRSEP